MSQHDPLFDFDARQRFEDMGDPPTRAALLQRWLSGEFGDDFDAWAEWANACYPMSVEEAQAARAKPYMGTFDAIIARREAERDAAKGGQS